jgi:hypothetical protein
MQRRLARFLKTTRRKVRNYAKSRIQQEVKYLSPTFVHLRVILNVMIALTNPVICLKMILRSLARGCSKIRTGDAARKIKSVVVKQPENFVRLDV